MASVWKLRTSSNVSLDNDILTAVDEAHSSLLSHQDLGFTKEGTLIDAMTECRKQQEFFKGKSALVIIGLGGSSLGTKALVESLYANLAGSKIHFLDNVDTFSVDRFLAELSDVETMGWVLCSKSGNTLEVTALYDHCHQFIESEYKVLILKNTCVLTETKESLLTDFAQRNGCITLPIPQDVGGRFSVFTTVGLFPMTFLGCDLDKVFSGFKQAVEQPKLAKSIAASLWASHLRGEMNFYSFQYSDRLSAFGLWLQQLWSESLSKAKTKQQEAAPAVATFVPCRGASDQHSVLQQVIEGAEKKFVAFHRVESSEGGPQKLANSQFSKSLMISKNLGELLAAEAVATEQSVVESGTATMALSTAELSAESMAHLMTTWMLVVGMLGELLGINAFDQPGVESGKVIARRVLTDVD